MGVIIKYLLEFTGVDLDISNDMWTSPKYLLDADIDVQMMRGSTGCRMTVKLQDLPADDSKELYQQVEDKSKQLGIKISLGYFDGSFEEVAEGVVTKLSGKISGDHMITEMTALEMATYALENTKYDDFKDTLNGDKKISETVTKLLSTVKEKKQIDITAAVDLDSEHDPVLTDRQYVETNLLKVLESLAKIADAEMLVGDQKFRMGRPIKIDDTKPDEFSRDSNLAVFQPFSTKIPDDKGLNVLKPMEATSANGFEFTITGDPVLRPGFKVSADVDSYKSTSGNEFRLHSVRHVFSTTKGYSCRGVALKLCAGDSCKEKEYAVGKPSADSVTRRLLDKKASDLDKKPAVDVAKIKEYEQPSHQASLYFGQRFNPAESQPSIRVAVDEEDKQVYLHKPILSPFAWHKCGLVVPVYPGMKAAMVHNLHMRNDGIVAGFIWSEEPKIEPPASSVGDWWLCLPIDFDSSNPPEDSTKAVNDLTTADGKRTISVKGLKIGVGSGSLTDVGVRPDLGGDDELVIEHAEGTVITIASDGAVSIEASKVSIKGDVEIEGNVDVK